MKLIFYKVSKQTAIGLQTKQNVFCEYALQRMMKYRLIVIS